MPSARFATAGPKPRPRTQARPRRVASGGPRVRVRWDRIGRVGLLIVLAVVAGLYVQDAIAFFSTHAQAEQQLSVVRHLVEANKGLERQQQALNNPATIQREARALGMVRPGERPYAITGMPNH